MEAHGKLRGVLLLLFALFFIALGPGFAASAEYSFTLFDVPGATWTIAGTINDRGQIAGAYGTQTDRNWTYSYGFIKYGSDITTFIFPDGYGLAMVTGINNSGQMVGTCHSYDGFIKKESNYTYLSGLRPMAINDDGIVVGWYRGSSYRDHGFILNGSDFTTVDYPGAYHTYVKGINNSGQIVGYYQPSVGKMSGFIKNINESTYTSFEIPSTIGIGVVGGISNSGLIVGSSWGGTGVSGFLKDGSNYITLSVPGFQSTYANSINSSGVIVGRASTGSGGPWGDHGFVATAFAPPIAEAGPDQTLHQINSSISLDGSGSTGSSALTYGWSVLTAPGGSNAGFSDPSMVNPTFTPDFWGDYELKLTVTDAEGRTAADTVNIKINAIPVAEPKADPQSVTAFNTLVQLDGSQSYDEDGEMISFEWSLSKPAESGACLSEFSATNPTFVADVFGDYYITLIVTDASGYKSPPTPVHVSFYNLPPVANAGLGQAVDMYTRVQLNGSGSYDPEGIPLTYQWNFILKPSESSAVLDNYDTVNPSFMPDWPGTYVVQLTVSDKLLFSDPPGTVQIQVSITGNFVVNRLQELSALIAQDIPPESFKNGSMKKAFLNKLNAVIAGIDIGAYQDAYNQLHDDILGKTDGCAVSEPPAPDRNDWLLTCSTQDLINDNIDQILILIRDLSLS